ncbi:type III secretion system translocon subunit SctE [Yokenella regensburgei]|uniref:type III secretion system translocon subunit SctE n=1 Tax=Yokenella regensburgei TaxID=158877 RepID=UPI0014333BFF|nr:type III secretion system translocon subunit SctE [Yokenella regensburgei]QIU92572.1 type III secretion system translocon subunit SctE [Yokenella regensburgei]
MDILTKVNNKYVVNDQKMFREDECGKTLFSSAENAMKKVLIASVGTTNNQAISSNRHVQIRPALKEPVSMVPTEDSSRNLTPLLRKLEGMLSDSSLYNTKRRLELLLERNKSSHECFKSNSQKLCNAIAESNKSFEDYKCALDELKSCKKELNEVTKNLNTLSSKDTGYSNVLNEQHKAWNEFDKAKNKAFSFHDVALVKASEVDNFLTGIQIGGGDFETIRQGEVANLSGIARMVELMGVLSQLVSKNNNMKIGNDMKIFSALQKARQEELERKSTEYLKSVEEAKKISKIFGIVGKIVGAILTVVSVVAAVFTGGASLVLAAIGVGLMVSDAIYEAATGESFIQKALQPVMDKTLMPLVETFSEFITSVLEDFGVDKNTAAMAGVISGAILAVVVVVAVVAVVAVVGKSIASKLGDILGNFLSKFMEKIIPDIVKKVATGIGDVMVQLVSKLVSLIGKSKETISLSLRQLLSAMVLAATSVQAGGGIAQSAYEEDASDKMADFTLSHGVMSQIQKWINQVVNASGEQEKVSLGYLREILVVMQQNNDAARYVLGNIHA